MREPTDTTTSPVTIATMPSGIFPLTDQTRPIPWTTNSRTPRATRPVPISTAFRRLAWCSSHSPNETVPFLRTITATMT